MEADKFSTDTERLQNDADRNFKPLESRQLVCAKKLRYPMKMIWARSK